jgi:hypothetical protein
MRQGFESNELWEQEVVSDAYTFWQFASESSPSLAELAMRLFETPANSVPSERAFSSMNLTHTRYRNRLTIEKLIRYAISIIPYQSQNPRPSKDGRT